MSTDVEAPHPAALIRSVTEPISERVQLLWMTYVRRHPTATEATSVKAGADAVKAKATQTSLGAHARSKGFTTVGRDDEGRLVRTTPDGTATVVD